VQRAAGAISRHHVRTCEYDVTAEYRRDRYLPVQNTLRANITLIVSHRPFAFSGVRYS
jgi:hypothetical protein